MASGPLYDS